MGNWPPLKPDLSLKLSILIGKISLPFLPNDRKNGVEESDLDTERTIFVEVISAHRNINLIITMIY